MNKIPSHYSSDFSEGALEKASEMLGSLEYTRCVRPDGSAYGTGGTCRKGSPEDKPDDYETKATARDAAFDREKKLDKRARDLIYRGRKLTKGSSARAKMEKELQAIRKEKDAARGEGERIGKELEGMASKRKGSTGGGDKQRMSAAMDKLDKIFERVAEQRKQNPKDENILAKLGKIRAAQKELYRRLQEEEPLPKKVGKLPPRHLNEVLRKNPV